jgi:hypothetical protein
MSSVRFEMHPKLFAFAPTQFSDTDAPDWLTSKNTVPGSTMDSRWFWNDHVLKLSVGQSVETEFNVIKRIQ